MQDEPAVRVRYGREHLQEQTDPRVHAQASSVTPAIDRLALDVLQDQIGLFPSATPASIR